MTTAAPLTLIGTLHRDPAGYERLLRLLEELRPGRLTLEMSPYALAYRQRRAPLLRERLLRLLGRLAAAERLEAELLRRRRAIAEIEDLLELPYEYRAARACALAAAIPLELIDLDEVSEQKLARVEEELISYANLRVLIHLPESGERPSEGYGAARALLNEAADARLREAFLARRRGPEGIGRRDRLMAQRLRRLAAQGGPLVHIGGWVHLVEDPRGETLYSRLRDLAPRRLLLGDTGAEP